MKRFMGLFQRWQVGRGMVDLLLRVSVVVAATCMRGSVGIAEQPPPGGLEALHVPDGFTIEPVAGPPLVEHPMMAGFDERGRLYVAEAAGLNLPAGKLLEDPPNKIVMLEDRDGDGQFDTRTVFADGMTLPMGALWHNGALYVASPPSLWRLEDTDGDGVADRRDEIVTRFGFSGNAASVHGPFLGPDGLLYWNDGRHGHEIETPEGKLTGLAARLFRCRPDGSGVERVCGGGFDNPVEVAFTAEGEMITTMTFYTNPHDGLRDALVHFVEGGVYPKEHDCLKEFVRTGPLLPPLAHLGVAACSGLMRYRGSQFGGAYADNLFSAQFNMHKVQRHVLQRRGSTFACTSEDFFTSDNTDVHPTDVLEDADGSLLVIDTGGWFRIGCPTSRIAKPEIAGAIYRIRRESAPVVSDARGLAMGMDVMKPAELVALLDDGRPAVRDRAVELLVQAGSSSLGALRDAVDRSPAPQGRRNAIWVLARIGTPEAIEATRRGLFDEDAGVRQAAARSAGTLCDEEAWRRLGTIVVIDEPQVRREAATALGRIGRAEANGPLLESLRKGGDQFLEHAVIYALIQIGDRDRMIAALGDPSPAVRRGALVALDQMPGGQLTRELVTPLLDTDDVELQQAALEVIGRRPGWGEETVGLLRRWLTASDLPESRVAPMRGALLAMCREPQIQTLVAGALRADETPTATRLILLEAVDRAGMDPLPEAWIVEVGRALSHGDGRVRRQAVATVRARNLGGFDEALEALADDEREDAELRIAALRALLPRHPQLNAARFELLETHLGEQTLPLLRLAAAQGVGAAQLSDTQLLRLARLLPDAGPLVLPSLVEAFADSHSERVGLALVSGLEDSALAPTLAPSLLQSALKEYPVAVQQAARTLTGRQGDDIEQRRARLAELEPLLAGGDVERGREVFFGKRASCFGCHRVAGQGGNVGPDLTRVGAIRSGMDLLEAIAFPSASFAQGFQPYVVVTQRGQVFSGILSRQTADAVYLYTADRTELRIGRGEIEEMSQSTTSIMPQGMDRLLSPAELRDLLAWLQRLH